MGAHPSRGLLFRWEDSGTEEDEKAEDTAAGSGSRPPEPEGGEESWSASPAAAAACSASRVGEEGGEGRDFFLLEDNSFRRLFFSLCSNSSIIYVLEKWFSQTDRYVPESGTDASPPPTHTNTHADRQT